MRFTIGLKYKGKVNHVVVDAEDALIAALKAKSEQPEAQIMYVRPQSSGRRAASSSSTRQRHPLKS